MDLVCFWWIKGLVGVAALFAVQYAVRRVVLRARLGQVFQLPLAVLIWVLGGVYLVNFFGEHLGLSMTAGPLDTLRKTVVVGSITWIFFRWKREMVLKLMTHPKVDPTTVHMIGRLATVAVVVLAGLIMLQIFGVNTAPLLAFGSIGAASIGFAGKDVMANFCSGIMLHVTRPFVIGEQISLPEKNLEGLIEDIGWFRTTLRDKDKRAVYLPNNFFSTMLLINVSRMTHRHLQQHLRIGFEHTNKVAEVVDKMREYLRKLPDIDTRYPVHVFLKAFGEYACDIEIDAYSTIIDQDAFNRFQHKTLLELQAILQAMHIHLALPTALWKTEDGP